MSARGHHGLLLFQGAPAVPLTWSTTNITNGLQLSNGNLTLHKSLGGAAWLSAGSASRAGKRYFELTCISPAGGMMFGMASAASYVATPGNFPGNGANGVGWSLTNGNIYVNAAVIATKGTVAGGDVVGIATDGAGSVWMAKNGVWYGDPVAGTGALATGLPTDLMPVAAFYDNLSYITARFAAADQTYAPPSGFAAYS